MRDKDLQLEEIEVSDTLGGVGEDRVQGREKWRGYTYVGLYKKTQDLSVSESEEGGNGEGGDVDV